MTIIPALAVAFAAFCVWLTVRFVNRREGWVRWTLAGAVGVSVLYVASFGPACWWFAGERPPSPRPLSGWGGVYKRGARYVPRIYWPIGQAMVLAPHSIRAAIGWYAKLHGKPVMVPLEWDGNSWIGAG